MILASPSSRHIKVARKYHAGRYDLVIGCRVRLDSDREFCIPLLPSTCRYVEL